RVEAALPAGVPVVRVMPNTPALVDEGMSVLSAVGGGGAGGAAPATGRAPAPAGGGPPAGAGVGHRSRPAQEAEVSRGKAAAPA
ncbi:hypothetical protein NH342_22430, partial [Klenkia sp. PcliD-1-E]|nr:hypothetical protein [Klenkia sp. PcliD-1-E]